MKKLSIRALVFIAPIIMCLSMVMLLGRVNSKDSGKTVFESEQDFKLKFVDSADYELGLSGITKVIMPLEIFSAEEKNGYIEVTTRENAVVLSPVACEVSYINGANGEIELKANNIRVVIIGLVSGVKVGDKIECGELIGTIKGEKCRFQVYFGTRKLSLSEIKVML